MSIDSRLIRSGGIAKNPPMKWIMVCTAMLVLSACDSSIEVLKSPCAGLEDSPCGPKRPVNDWWLKQDDASASDLA